MQAAEKASKFSPDSTSWTDSVSNVTHLHLEGRGIRTISNLDSCYAVRVLYLYNNRIDAIRGLENLRQLTHLYLQVMPSAAVALLVYNFSCCYCTAVSRLFMRTLGSCEVQQIRSALFQLVPQAYRHSCRKIKSGRLRGWTIWSACKSCILRTMRSAMWRNWKAAPICKSCTYPGRGFHLVQC